MRDWHLKTLTPVITALNFFEMMPKQIRYLMHFCSSVPDFFFGKHLRSQNDFQIMPQDYLTALALKLRTEVKFAHCTSGEAFACFLCNEFGTEDRGS